MDLLLICCGLVVGVLYMNYFVQNDERYDMDDALLACSSMYVASAAVVMYL